MKDMNKTYKLKVYLKGRAKPVVIETDKEKYIDLFYEDLITKDVIKIGPFIFLSKDFKFAIAE